MPPMNRFLLLAMNGLYLLFLFGGNTAGQTSDMRLEVGIAEREITPPAGYPMAGYYHERLAQGQLDPLKAKAIVMHQGEETVAVVFCDLTGIASDLTHAIRAEVSRKSNLKPDQIILCATHSHTAPDYYRDLYLHLSPNRKDEATEYPSHLIARITQAIFAAEQAMEPVEILIGSPQQKKPVAFNRRFVMRDGSVKTWQKLDNPNVVRAAGPIDPDLAFCLFRSQSTGEPQGVLSHFALHLDTVGGSYWSADYPFYIEQAVQKSLGESTLSLFGLGCCGDINHVDPSKSERNKTDYIGTELGQTLSKAFDSAALVSQPRLVHQSNVVPLSLRPITTEQADRGRELMLAAKEGVDVEFFDLVKAYKSVILAQFQLDQYQLETNTAASWGLSHQLAGCGKHLPVEVHTVGLGPDVAIVFLPGEVFVDLGLAIKQASPFKHTLVIELSNAVETAYIPTQAAFAGGSYEVTNSTILAGSGERLVEEALRQLGQAAKQLQEAGQVE
jgi:neutral ceramidase